MKKWDVISKLLEQKIVAVLRGNSHEQVEQFANHCIVGGMKAIEITFTVPGALTTIERLREHYKNDSEVVIGGGTVLDTETARLAILAGAQFVVTPYLNEEVVKLCNRYQVPVMPGAITVKEVIAALEVGADIIKLFPGDLAGPKMISAIKGPIPQANLMPTGGVNLENIQDWFAAGAIAVGIGSDLTNDALQTGNYQLITEKARSYLEKIQNL